MIKYKMNKYNLGKMISSGNSRRPLLISMLLSLPLIALSGCNNMQPVQKGHSAPVTHHPAAKTPMASMNVVQLAQSNTDFSILVEAVVAAGLADALSNPNAQFTIFAPTNSAFASLLAETGMTKQQLLANKPLLQKVLGYHVINGAAPIYAKDVKPGQVMTLGQQSFTITPQTTLMDGKGRTANIIKTDLAATNGVVHVIDKVLLPAK